VLARFGLAAMWMLHFLPLALLARAGESLGMLFYAFGLERRRVCLLNLARCLPELAASERSALARRHFRAVGGRHASASCEWCGSPASSICARSPGSP